MLESGARPRVVGSAHRRSSRARELAAWWAGWPGKTWRERPYLSGPRGVESPAAGLRYPLLDAPA